MQISKSSALVKQALDYRAARQDMIASNIANADTPFYRPRDISFEDTLAKKSEEIFGKHTKELKMASTQDGVNIAKYKDIDTSKASVFFRDGHMARNDGNSVDIDVETTEMSKNSVMFSALTAALKKDSMMFKSVLEASAKTQ